MLLQKWTSDVGNYSECTDGNLWPLSLPIGGHDPIAHFQGSLERARARKIVTATSQLENVSLGVAAHIELAAGLSAVMETPKDETKYPVRARLKPLVVILLKRKI